MAKIYGQLERAQIENVGALPTPGVKGRYVFLTTDSKFYFDDGTAFREVFSPTSTVPITSGGTGQTSATAAFDALAPTTTAGDIIVHNGTDNVRLPIGTDGQTVVVDTSQTNKLKWATLPQGTKNYVTYNNFENNAITGWNEISATYSSNTPSGTPTISASAAANVALSVTSTNPLAGTYSLQAALTAPAVGVGFCSDALTLDREDRAKVLQGSFYYEVVSGTGNFSGTSSNTFSIWILQDNGSTLTWTQPAGVYNMVQSSGQGKASFTFQTNSDTTTVRVVVFVNAAATTVTVNFDDFVLGPQVTAAGSAIGDWVYNDFVPSFTNLTLGNATYETWRRRVGDTEEVELRVTFGTTTSVSGGLTWLFPRSVDTAKLDTASSNRSKGIWSALDASSTIAYTGKLRGGSTGYLMQVDNSASTYVGLDNLTASVPFTWTTSDVICIRASYPVLGWSSNSVMSADTDTRVVAARVTSTDVTSIASSGTAILVWNGSTYDTHGAVSSNKFTAPISGKYKVLVNVNFNASANTINQYIEMRIRKNGATYPSYSTQFIQTATSVRLQQTLSDTIDLNAGDYIDVYVNNQTGTAKVPSGTANDNYWSIERISGPATIAASEKIIAKYTASTTDVIDSTVSGFLNWATKEIDTHGAVAVAVGAYTSSTGTHATSEWTFTAPRSDYYRLSAYTVSGNHSIPADAIYSLIALKNGGTVEIGGDNTQGAITGRVRLDATTIFQLNAGDTIKMKATNGSLVSTSMIDSSGNICIESCGN
jgi:hypothetical protein